MAYLMYNVVNGAKSISWWSLLSEVVLEPLAHLGCLVTDLPSQSTVVRCSAWDPHSSAVGHLGWDNILTPHSIWSSSNGANPHVRFKSHFGPAMNPSYKTDFQNAPNKTQKKGTFEPLLIRDMKHKKNDHVTYWNPMTPTLSPSCWPGIKPWLRIGAPVWSKQSWKMSALGTSNLSQTEKKNATTLRTCQKIKIGCSKCHLGYYIEYTMHIWYNTTISRCSGTANTWARGSLFTSPNIWQMSTGTAPHLGVSCPDKEKSWIVSIVTQNSIHKQYIYIHTVYIYTVQYKKSKQERKKDR